MVFYSLLDVDLYLTESNLKISPGYNKLPGHIVFKHKLVPSLISQGKIKVDFEPSDRAEIISYIKNIELTVEKSEKMTLNNKYKFSVKGQFYDYSGYAKVNRNIVRCLNSISPVAIDPIDIKNMKLNKEDILDISDFPLSSDACVKIDSIVPSNTYASIGKFNSKIIYTTIETSTVNKDICAIIDSYDEIWTTSNFCKESMISSGIKKNIKVVPGPISINKYDDISKIDLTGQVKKFIFLSVFNWNYRKAPEVLIKSYIKEFSSEDDVTLLMVCRSDKSCNDPNLIRSKIDNIIKKEDKGSLTPHIARYSQPLSESQLRSLYRSCNVYVQPSRGEGYGLPYIEASMCGLPVVSTKWGGQLDFLNDSNSTLVEIDKMEKLSSQTGVYFWDSESMPYLLTDSFIKRFGMAMRENYEDYKNKLNKVNNVKENIINYLSEDKVTKYIRDLYENI